MATPKKKLPSPSKATRSQRTPPAVRPRPELSDSVKRKAEEDKAGDKKRDPDQDKQSPAAS